MKRFSLAANKTAIVQGFFDGNGNGMNVVPGMVIDTSSLKSSASQLTPVETVLEAVKPGQPLVLVRTFSLGDVLMLVPIVRKLKELGIRAAIKTMADYEPALEALGIETVRVIPRHCASAFMDYVVERDHVDHQLAKMHRVEIYADMIGIPKEARRNWDWSMDSSKFPQYTNDKYVVFQGAGSNKAKSLALKTAEWVCAALNIENVTVVYLGDKRGLDQSMLPLTKLSYMARSVADLFGLIGGAQCLITMDSGPLWVAHFTKTPTIAILGPSRPAERTSLHPLYPEGAVAIDTAKAIGCEPCLEKAVACGKTFKCLGDISGEKLYGLMRDDIMRFWEAS